MSHIPLLAFQTCPLPCWLPLNWRALRRDVVKLRHVKHNCQPHYYGTKAKTGIYGFSREQHLLTCTKQMSVKTNHHHQKTKQNKKQTLQTSETNPNLPQSVEFERWQLHVARLWFEFSFLMQKLWKRGKFFSSILVFHLLLDLTNEVCCL